MTIPLYMDHHVARAITAGLKARGIDIVTAYEDGADQLPDEALLNRATALKRVLFTQDYDLLMVAAQRQEKGESFCGVIFAHQTQVSIGNCIRDLEIIAKACELEDFHNLVQYLPI